MTIGSRSDVALSYLLPAVYDELRRVAHYLRRERDLQATQATGLVHRPICAWPGQAAVVAWSKRM